MDTSCIVGNALGQEAAVATRERLRRFPRVVSSPLLEAELYSALVREGRDVGDEWTNGVELVIADRPLSLELRTVLAAGYVRGADAWHLATALYLSPDPTELTFLTLNTAQRRVAETLGFAV